MGVESILGMDGEEWKQKRKSLGLVSCVGLRHNSEVRLGLWILKQGE